MVKTRLQSLPGVGSAQIFGERRYLDAGLALVRRAGRRAGSRCRTSRAAIQSRNVEIPAGRIESDRREFSVRSLGELKTPHEFGDLVVTSQGGQLVKLRDLGRVELGAAGRAQRAPLQGHAGRRPSAWCASPRPT